MLLNILLLPVQKRLPFVGTVGYRLYCNLYNAGIATLSVYSIITGVLDIADTSSSLLIVLLSIGWIAVAAGLVVLFVLLFNVRKALIRQTRTKTKPSGHIRRMKYK